MPVCPTASHSVSGSGRACVPASAPHKGASIVRPSQARGGNTMFIHGSGRSRLWTCLLRMETPPLRMGDVPFTDGNAAARTFGQAHRRRPYHFSCGSMSQGCRRIVCRRTNIRNVCRRIVRRRTKSKMIAGEQFADGLNRKRLPANSSPTD